MEFKIIVANFCRRYSRRSAAKSSRTVMKQCASRRFLGPNLCDVRGGHLEWHPRSRVASSDTSLLQSATRGLQQIDPARPRMIAPGVILAVVALWAFCIVLQLKTWQQPKKPTQNLWKQRDSLLQERRNMRAKTICIYLEREREKERERERGSEGGREGGRGRGGEKNKNTSLVLCSLPRNSV